MGSKFWIKLYIEMLNDRKVARLSTHLRWRMVECFLLAGLMDKGGELPPVDEAAWLLRLPVEQLEADWLQLVDAGILGLWDTATSGQDEDGYYVVNFEKRQAPASDRERAAEHRKRKHRDEYYGVTEPSQAGHDAVTNRDPGESAMPEQANHGASNDVVTNRDNSVTEREKREKERTGGGGGSSVIENLTAAAAGEAQGMVFSLYEQEIGPLTPHIGDELGDLLDSYSPAWVAEAIQIASQNNVRKVSYVSGVLRRWFIEGKDYTPGSNTTPPTLDDELERRGYAA
jgi:DnaD/phage-associated family protein